MTNRAKLLYLFLAVLALILAPLVVYQREGRQSHRQLEEVIGHYNRKLDIGTQVELATTEMQGSQRGLMLSYAMKDPAASQQYVQLYATNGDKIDRLMGELEPLLASEAEKSAAADIRGNREAWAPRFQKLIGLCVAGQIEEGYRLRNENKMISAKMHAAATTLVQQQKKALERAQADSEAAVARSNWIAAWITLLSLAVGAVIFLGVRKEIRKVRELVADLRETAVEVARASRQVASSSEAVAQGASRQSASVEETSGSTEEISAMTRQNRDQLRAAADLGVLSSQAIGDANQTLGKMQISMQEINVSCEKVGRVIRVIDEIAFQTNILALNAAVESARAGEAGMGFAVVAGEVRILAQRSAKAASETEELIQESIAKSKLGRETLENVSGAIGKMTASAAQIAALVEGVKTGSEEQARGIQQIAEAMVHIGQETQSSAAAAEETAAVGEQMDAQSGRLEDIVLRLHRMVE